jgi:type IX secretion system PorP/SprF family membrane protein
MKYHFSYRYLWQYLVVSLCLLLTFPISAQDFQINNGFATPLYLNGGYAGANEQNELALQVQKTGGSLSLPGFNHVATIDFRVPKLRGGIGLVWASEFKKQLWNYSLLKGIYALNLQVQENLSIHPFLSLGLGINHLSEDYMLIGSSLQGPLNKAYFTPGAGILVKYGTFYAGFSAEHFTRPDVSWENTGETLDPEFILHAKYQHQIEPGITMQPGLTGRKQGLFTSVTPSLELNYQGFITGLNAIHSTFKDVFNLTGFGGMIGIELNTIRIVYAFTGKVAGDNLPYYLPAHEFSLAYRFREEK